MRIMSFRRGRSLLPRSAAAAAAVAALLWSGNADAQYFGRNKVQYKKFDFQVLKTEHFDIYFYPSERDGIDIAAKLAERWETRLERLLSHKLRGRQPLVLYASHSDFEQTNIIGGELGLANDFTENRKHIVNRAVKTIGIQRTQDPAVVMARYNYWGEPCPAPIRFVGNCHIRPWTDARHRDVVDACPDSTGGAGATGDTH